MQELLLLMLSIVTTSFGDGITVAGWLARRVVLAEAYR